jgi:hypothetical protein
LHVARWHPSGRRRARRAPIRAQRTDELLVVVHVLYDSTSIKDHVPTQADKQIPPPPHCAGQNLSQSPHAQEDICMHTGVRVELEAALSLLVLRCASLDISDCKWSFYLPLFLARAGLGARRRAAAGLVGRTTAGLPARLTAGLVGGGVDLPLPSCSLAVPSPPSKTVWNA